MRYTSLKKQDRAEDGMEVRLVHSSNETVQNRWSQGTNAQSDFSRETFRPTQEEVKIK